MLFDGTNTDLFKNGKISDDGLLMDYSPVVQAAQADYAAGDRCAALVDISAGIGWSDDWHYDSASYLRLGTAFAEAMHSLRADCP